MSEFRSMMRRAYKTEPIDQYLSSIGLYRKITAKDGSCLFRAVAEQIFYTQVFHYAVREACINFMSRHREQFEPFIEGSFDHYLFHLKNPKEWAGQVEISALSLLYKRDFLIYQLPGKPPTDVTQNGFDKRIMLCFSHGNHYDSVFTREFQHNAAVCQAVLYEILYKEVFKVPREAVLAVEILRESSSESPEMDERMKKRPPLPYRVAKALDPEIYRNVEFDSWNENKKDQQQQDLIMARGLQYSPGEKCQVMLSNEKKYFEGHIQEVAPNDGSVTVFIQEIGEKRTVPMKNLRPIVSFPPSQVPRLANTSSYKSLPGYYQKYTPDLSDNYRSRDRPPRRGKPPIHLLHPSFSPSNGLAFDQQNIPYSLQPDMPAGRGRPRLPSPHKQQAPRFMNRNTNQNEQFMPKGRGWPSHRKGKAYDSHRVSSPIHDVVDQNGLEKQEMEEALRFIELQERDQMSFPSLPRGGNGPSDLSSQASFWSKYRMDHNGRRSVSPSHQLRGTPSPVSQIHRDGDIDERALVSQMQHASIASSSPVESETHYTVTVKGAGDMDIGQTVTITSDPNQPPPHSWASPSSVVSSGTTYQFTASSGPSPHGPSPQTVYSSSPIPQPISVGLPFYPMILPVPDNFIGPINSSADISRDPQGQDLPSDVSTLRYFYNLGVEYQRRLYIVQYQQQQAAVMQQPFAQVSSLPAPSATMYNTLPVVQTSLGPVHPMMTPADAGQVMIESQVTSSSSLSEEAEETEDSRQLTAGQENASQSQHFSDASYQQAIPTHSASPTLHPLSVQPSPHPSGTQVIYQQQPSTLSQVPGMASYAVPSVSQWQPGMPYGSPSKVTPISVQSNTPVTLLTSNTLHAPQMQQQQPHLVPQGAPVLTPAAMHGVGPSSMYTQS
ncbi:OTU domain-containing protein 4 [Holothuria leucospilota]|uniref:OTU domain-containing protein 4 n=1 Tax=Holothuria leucospilota TaxID=206669 RepID=A0A9Q1BLH2_HOLLE|nr:OTU domain-containing protein 4 [Holothuria leucospilota]